MGAEKRTVYKDGLFKPHDSDVWHYVVEVNGHRIKKSSGERSLRAAKAARETHRAQLRAAAPVRRDRSGGTLAELAGKDVARAKAKGATKQQQDAIEFLWSIVTAHFGPDASPRVITHDSVVEFLAANRLVITVGADGKPVRNGYAGQSLRRCVHALKRGMKSAKRLGWVATVLDEWPEVASDPKKADQAGKLHPPEILANWIAAIADRKSRDVARLYYVAGLRRSEMQRLARNWVHRLPAPLELAGVRFVALLRAPDWATKTRDAREILLDQESVDAIERGAAELDDKLDPDTTPCMVGHFRKSWASARKAIGYKPQITPRDLRHCCRTYGGGGDAARHSLGHSDERTSAIYDHPFLERLATFSAGVHGAVFGASIHPSQSTPGSGDAVKRSGQWDSNSRPPAPKAESALAEHVSGCLYCQRVVAKHIELQRNAPRIHPRIPPQATQKRSAS